MRRCSCQRSSASASRQPPRIRNIVELPYPLPASSTSTMPSSGPAASGSIEVAAIGSASVAHQVAISSVSAAARHAVTANPAGSGTISITAKTSAPSQRPSRCTGRCWLGGFIDGIMPQGRKSPPAPRTVRESPAMTSLRQQTLFITGASRGIGLAIALRAARDGANTVIAAKTAEPHPKLPGTIYTAAAEIEKAGGQALPLVVDVRDEMQIAKAVEAAVAKFGGI